MVELASHSYPAIRSLPYRVEWWSDDGFRRSEDMPFDAATHACAAVEALPGTYGVALCVTTAIGRRPDYTATPTWAISAPAPQEKEET